MISHLLSLLQIPGKGNTDMPQYICLSLKQQKANFMMTSYKCALIYNSRFHVALISGLLGRGGNVEVNRRTVTVLRSDHI